MVRKVRDIKNTGRAYWLATSMARDPDLRNDEFFSPSGGTVGGGSGPLEQFLVSLHAECIMFNLLPADLRIRVW
eukprot:CAMPEP_0178486012 /NCGR_PEP_ID=MMETSP0696-20121128/8580_1 /TAXON_ID=265572 /ORGANISM="Extubocellulus spinifer, Strain CCMP396" /LENGTH=73 /DNA_ID=CAMNT_0020113647 /DNA_START=134 /DNA_END=352 /DNA_ORIENTATION=+